ncbi:ferredoxin [Streptosporangium sp. NPDC051022]|uniref:ferredoxin n=1 Tax=Streptosporangium sp. NPDC051022 TaxID=3155752 RepID=UPI00343AF7CA
MTPLACPACDTRVRVRKASVTQTSIQWGPDAASTCAEFARRTAVEHRDITAPGCTALFSAIADAYADGSLPRID